MKKGYEVDKATFTDLNGKEMYPITSGAYISTNLDRIHSSLTNIAKIMSGTLIDNSAKENIENDISASEIAINEIETILEEVGVIKGEINKGNNLSRRSFIITFVSCIFGIMGLAVTLFQLFK